MERQRTQSTLSWSSDSVAGSEDLRDVEVTTSMDLSLSRRRKLRWYHNVGDFFNCLKAFIGTNYQALPFAFCQSGLAFGIVGVFIIAVATDHCVLLLVKCKNIVIDRACRDQMDKGQLHPSEERLLRQRLEFSTSYGDVGRRALGPWCFHLIQVAVWFTQFMTVMSYYIFLGNTVYAMFPLRPVPYLIHNATRINTTLEAGSPWRGHGVPILNIHNIDPPASGTQPWDWDSDLIDTADSQKSFRNISRSKRGLSDRDSIFTGNIVNENLIGTQNIVVLEVPSKTQTNILEHVEQPYSMYDSNSTAALETNHTEVISTTVPSRTITTAQTMTTMKTVTSTHQTITTSESMNATTTTAPETTTTHALAPTDTPAIYMRSVAPPLRLIILLPLPIFLLTSLIRKVRYLAPFSSIATFALFSGAMSVLGYMIATFKFSHFEWYKFYTLPLFLGQLMSAYEGIGCVIPIQSSMEGNRHLFPAFLHGAVSIVFVILCAFGILGYMSYGDKVKQIILLDVLQPGIFSTIVDVTLIISVVFTYPLQCFPVIDILEVYIFAPRKPRRPRAMSANDQDPSLEAGSSDDDRENLLQNSSIEASAREVSLIIPDKVPTWKRNTLRVSLTLMAVGLAILLKDAYAYTASFTGAIGASLLAFILPCLIHLNLQWNSLSVLGKVKDICIIVCAIVASVLTLIAMAMLMIKKYRSGHIHD